MLRSCRNIGRENKKEKEKQKKKEKKKKERKEEMKKKKMKEEKKKKEKKTTETEKDMICTYNIIFMRISLITKYTINWGRFC